MKKLLLIMLVLIISACSKSDESQVINESNENLLIGKWYAVQYSQSEEPLSECEKKGYIELLENGHYLERSFDIENNDCYGPYETSGLWSINAGILILDDITENHTYYIEKYEISGKKLTLHRPPLHPPYDEIFIEIYEKR